MVSPVTVTLQTADLPEPSAAVAVIVAAPALTAVTVPSGATVATASSEDAQVKALLAAFSGATVAVSVSLFPTEIEVSALLSVIWETGTVSGVTVRS